MISLVTTYRPLTVWKNWTRHWASRGEAFKNHSGRRNFPEIMNEDIKVINRWSCLREKGEEDSSSLLYTMPLFPATFTTHCVINDPSLQNIHFISFGSHAILGKFLGAFLSPLRHTIATITSFTHAELCMFRALQRGAQPQRYCCVKNFFSFQ